MGRHRGEVRPGAASVRAAGLGRTEHRHHDEDEYTFVLTGRIGAILEGQEVMAEPGDLTEPATPEQGNEMAAPYHCDTNMDSPFPLVERHGLRF